MEEEKKNNKGLKVVIIIFLIICLIGILYFMFKMTYVGDKKKEENQMEDITEPTTGNINELTAISLIEGEEIKETIGGKEFTFKGENKKYYLNNKEVETKGEVSSKYIIYFTNNLIIFPYNVGQFGDKFIIYNLNEELVDIDDKGGQEAQYLEIRFKDYRLLVDAGTPVVEPCSNEAQCFFERIDTKCEDEKNKYISEYPEEIEKHKNDKLNTTTYEIKYNNNQVVIEKAEDIDTLEKWIDTFYNVCLKEESK